MEEKKFIVIYSLVSSAAKRYLESECLSGNEDFIIYLNNHDVSATKLKMNQRTKLTDLLRLIKDGKVKKVISYNIDKLKQ
jgi:site-specific DNA recombinase